MGYTHRLDLFDATTATVALPRVARDLRSLLAAGSFAFPLAGPRGRGEPEIDDHAIAFNGLAPKGDYESLLVTPDESRVFVKTGSARATRRPYDLAVTVTFALFRWHAGEHAGVASDGSLADWAPATQLIVRELGYPVDPYFVLRREVVQYRVAGVDLWVEKHDRTEEPRLERVLELLDLVHYPNYAPPGTPAAALALQLPRPLAPGAISRVHAPGTLPPDATPLSDTLTGVYVRP